MFNIRKLKLGIRLILVILFSTFYSSWAISAENQDQSPISYKDHAIAAAEMLQENLKKELMTAMQEDGVEAAIHACSEKAPLIAQEISEKSGLKIGRTSLRQRNNKNKPDSWEEAILKQFNKQKQQGAAAVSMEAVYQDDEIFRYMKAIPMNEMCMTCHGDNIEADLYQNITKYYPDDHAIGFALDDVRGAFTVSIPVKE